MRAFYVYMIPVLGSPTRPQWYPPPPPLFRICHCAHFLHMQENPNPHHATGGEGGTTREGGSNPPRHRKGEPLGEGGGGHGRTRIIYSCVARLSEGLNFLNQ